MIYQIPQLFPTSNVKNLVICIPAPGGKKEFSPIISDCIPDLHFNGDSQCFPMYWFEDTGVKREGSNYQKLLELDDSDEPRQKYIKKDGVSDFIIEKVRRQYKDTNLSKEDVFYYVYGILHSPEYCKTFSNDLKKELPRIPLVETFKEFQAFSKAGRKLADLHLNYETVPPFKGIKVTGAESKSFKVTKMKFPQKDQKDTIIYNSKITISGIPEKAYRYVVNGKSAVEWIMERYQVSTDSDSGITNDPNDWTDEVGNPRYILDLLISVINVSVQTVDIVEGLPKLKFE